MSQSPTPIRRGADARDTEAFAKQIAASLLTQNDAPQPVSPVPETKKPLIEMHGIRKSYYIGRPNELEILHGIDLTVYPGEFVAIVGESGSGKSTLMNIIGVLDRPTEGSYTLEVGSAGAERALKRPSDFQQFLGSPVLVKLYKPVDGRKEFPGTLTAYNEADGSLTVDLNGTAYTFGKKDVALCRLRVEF